MIRELILPYLNRQIAAAVRLSALLLAELNFPLVHGAVATRRGELGLQVWYKKPMAKKKTHTEPLMEYCEFFETEDEVIAHCREVNRGLTSKDPTPFWINADGGEGK
jgi:hypothetical protein